MALMVNCVSNRTGSAMTADGRMVGRWYRRLSREEEGENRPRREELQYLTTGKKEGKNV
jgi:hypothetical protein